MPKISIIIPTYNEEKYLPKLLDSIRRQTFEDYEIIVSDSYSRDKTREIAKRYGSRVVIGPKKGPGAGRNLGAKHAKGKILVFFDADVVLKRIDTLEAVYKAIKEGYIGGTFEFKPLDGGKKEEYVVRVARNLVKLFYKMGIPFSLDSAFS